jgi:hypothetical protein
MQRGPVKSPYPERGAAAQVIVPVIMKNVVRAFFQRREPKARFEVREDARPERPSQLYMFIQGVRGFFTEGKTRDLLSERDQCIGKPVRLARNAVRRVRRKFLCKECDSDNGTFF